MYPINKNLAIWNYKNVCHHFDASERAKKAAATRKENDPDAFVKMGRKGGKASHGGENLEDETGQGENLKNNKLKRKRTNDKMRCPLAQIKFSSNLLIF